LKRWGVAAGVLDQEAEEDQEVEDDGGEYLIWTTTVSASHAPLVVVVA